MIRVVVSACLLGSPVRHDGRDKYCGHPVLRRWIEEGRVVSVCPEMLGGLATPRPPAEITMLDEVRHVLTRGGNDVTREFEAGAEASAAIASANNARIAILKSGSPSCGSSYVYDGTFTRSRTPGEGVTTALLRERGIAVFSEDEIDEADTYLASLEAR
ncbi:MAG TPA: DUF523 domain-containing protein [Thermoanaerobaculia bacterium]|nr:DUF523 domain-containing protein [Thermoanaerobaculia bacterium]